MSRKGLTLVEVVVIIAIILVLVLVALPLVDGGRLAEAQRRKLCAQNLWQWGTIFQLYAAESEGHVYPPMQSDPEFAMAPRVSAVYPQYLTDLSILHCPSDSEIDARDLKYRDGPKKGQWRVLDTPGLADTSYVYLGWVFDRIDDRPEYSKPINVVSPTLARLMKESTLAGWADHPPSAEAKLAQLAATVPPGHDKALDATVGRTSVCAQFARAFDCLQSEWHQGDRVKPFQEDITLAVGNGNRDGTTIHRLAQGAEKFMVTDVNDAAALAVAAATIPVMFDTFADLWATLMFNHIPGGSNVLYLDGHVEFVRYPSVGPITRQMGQLLPHIGRAFGAPSGASKATKP